MPLRAPAEITYHAGRKKKPWQEHLEFLGWLTGVLADLDEPYVVAGDFNQRTPRVKGCDHQAAEALDTTSATSGIVTAGTVPGYTKPGIDHIAISAELRAIQVQGWPANVAGNRLSDHDGAWVEIGDMHSSRR